MAERPTDKYSAGEQGLGYIYQARLALLHLLQLPEDNAVFLEKDDDLDFVGADGGKSLASLKHKATGDRLTDLSTDFWKSVNIWLARYKRDGRAASNLRFFLFTTATVSADSFLARLLPDQPVPSEHASASRRLRRNKTKAVLTDSPFDQARRRALSTLEHASLARKRRVRAELRGRRTPAMTAACLAHDAQISNSLRVRLNIRRPNAMRSRPEQIVGCQ